MSSITILEWKYFFIVYSSTILPEEDEPYAIETSPCTSELITS